MSTIQAIAFRRNQLRRVRDAFREIERPGVYILIGSDDDAQDRQLAYIGESEGVGARLSYHNSNEAGRDAKGFWTDTVVLISKDENLTKSHARYVEACLIRGVGSNPRWTLPNTRTPSDDAGKLPLPDRAAMDEFVGQTKTLVGALGWDLFREIRGRAPDQMLERNLPKVYAHESRASSFVAKGSRRRLRSGHPGTSWLQPDRRRGSERRERYREARLPSGTLSSRRASFEKKVISSFSQATTVSRPPPPRLRQS
jgi:hypothetical protein